jgi:glycosyltransferase involved in cell wall biosynthesis
MQRLEILVINDGSKDSSSQIGHEYESKYPESFRVIDKENGNYGSCVNRGLKEATGKYVKILDADDYFDRYILDSYISFLLDKTCDLVITNHCQVDLNGVIEWVCNYNFPTNEAFTFQLFDERSTNHFYHQNVTYRLNILRQINYVQTEGISYTDNEWVFKPIMSVQTILYFPYNLYLYLRGREGQTFDPKVLRRSYSQRLVVFKSMIGHYSKYFSRCIDSNKSFVRKRLVIRLKEFYYYYLCVDGSLDGNIKLRDFDYYLLEKAPDIFEGMGAVTNNLGWHFINKWRKCNYNRNTIMIVFLRMKHKVMSRINCFVKR